MYEKEVIEHVMEEVALHTWVPAKHIAMYGAYIELNSRDARIREGIELEDRYDYLADLHFRYSKIGEFVNDIITIDTTETLVTYVAKLLTEMFLS